MRKSNRVSVLVVVPTALMGLIAATRVRALESNSNGYRLSQLSWIAGAWRAELGGEILEEIWMPPSGDCMVGVFRWLKGGKLWMFEALAITQEEQGIFLRLKHFDNRMVGWEDKDKAMSWKLVQADDKDAVFENPQQDTSRMTYHRDNESAITVTLDGTKDGKPNRTTFQYKRRPG